MELVPLKEFHAKCGNLPILEEYGEVMSEEYWAHWMKKEYEDRGKEVSWIDADKRRVGIEDIVLVK